MPQVFNGMKVRALRQAQGVRPEELAHAIDRSAPAVLGYENGRVFPPIAVASRIADALGVEFSDLLIEQSSR